MFLFQCLSKEILFLLTFASYTNSMNQDIYPLKSERVRNEKQCEVITIPMCKGIHYNMTRMPNMFDHESQSEAGFEAHQYFPLVQIQCSEDLRFFVCSVFIPICLKEYSKPLLPCRSVCERVKKGCEPLLAKIKFKWPHKLDCNQFPEYNNPEKVLCMEKNLSTTSSTSKSVSSTASVQELSSAEQNQIVQQTVGSELSFQLSRELNHQVFCQCNCKKPLIEISEINKAHFNRVSTIGLSNCAQPCKSEYFASVSDQTFISFWLGLWTILCMISTFLIIATFSIDPGRFRYPERPLIFMSICYFMVSLGFLLRISLGHEHVSCDVIKSTSAAQASILKYGGSGTAQCTIVFLFIYYFGMASSIWWVILTFTWFLAAGLKWGSEAIAKYSQIYHFLAWFLPGMKSILALTMSAVDGDPVSGICYVGNTSDFNLILFVLAPLLIYLTIGTLVLLSGFASLFRIRNIIKVQTGGKTEKLEKLMIRIGVFSVLYTAPAAIMLACLVYELQHRSKWSQNLACECFDVQRKKINLPQPSFVVHMLKYFMFMGVGITSGFWIWSRKTIVSWKLVCIRLGIGSCFVDERHKHTSLTNADGKQTVLLRHSNMLTIDNGSCNSHQGAIKGTSSLNHCTYDHSHLNLANIGNPSISQPCFISQNGQCGRTVLASAPSAPLPTPPQSSGQSTPPLCIMQPQNPYLQHLQDSKDLSLQPFISSHDTNPSCYFSSSGCRSNASSGIPLKSSQFSVAQL